MGWIRDKVTGDINLSQGTVLCLEKSNLNANLWNKENLENGNLILLKTRFGYAYSVFFPKQECLRFNMPPRNVLIPPAIFQYLQRPLMGGQKSLLYFLIYALPTTVDSGHSCDESERHRKRINPRNPFLSLHVHAWACMVDRRIIKLNWILLVKIEDLSSIFRFCVSRLNKNGKKKGDTRHKKSNAVKQSS